MGSSVGGAGGDDSMDISWDGSVAMVAMGVGAGELRSWCESRSWLVGCDLGKLMMEERLVLGEGVAPLLTSCHLRCSISIMKLHFHPNVM